MDWVSKLFKKQGIKDYSDLNDDERKTYRDWDEALRGRKITDEDVSLFLNKEKEEAIERMLLAESGSKIEMFHKAELAWIRKIQNFLDAPAKEKAMAEVAIKQLIES